MINNETGIEVVILAGGYGTRLRPVLDDIPKALAPVRGKPFLEYILNWLAEYNTVSIILSVGHKADAIVSHFGNNFKGITLKYVYEAEPLGTGGGILNALKYIGGRDFLALNGDTFFPVDIQSLISQHLDLEGGITVALKETDDCGRFGSVNVDDGNNIVAFNEKMIKGHSLINGGIYIINKEFIQETGLPSRCSFEKDVLEKYAGTGQIKGIVFSNTFLDIGVPDDYDKATSVL